MCVSVVHCNVSGFDYKCWCQVKRRSMSKEIKTALMYMAFGIIFQIPPLFYSTGFGLAKHSDYTYAKIFFPYAMIFMKLTNGTINLAPIISAVIQYPIYGFLIGYSIAKKAENKIILLIACLHIIFVIICLK